MALIIVWTPQAEKGLEKVLKYLDEEWTVIEILNLKKSIEDLLRLVSRFPNACPLTGRYKNLHKGIVDKNNYIIYRVKTKSGVIEIVNFKGTKDKPLKL